MRLKDIKESSSGGSTSAGSIATVNGPIGSPKNGQFFGGDPNASIYGPIKKHRKDRKKEVEESGKVTVLGANKVTRNPMALGPTDKVAPEGPVLGKPAGKKNKTLSKKFFGCSIDQSGKNVLAEEILNYNEFRNANKAIEKECPVCHDSFKNVHSPNQIYCSKVCDIKGSNTNQIKEAFDLFNQGKDSQTKTATKAGFIPYWNDSGTVRMLFVLSSDPAYGGSQWMVAKGRVDPGENAMQAALREAHEESGLRQNNLIPGTTKLGWRGEITGYTETSIMEIYIGEVKDPRNFDKPGFEISETKWLTPEEYAQIGRKSQNNIVQTCAKSIPYKITEEHELTDLDQRASVVEKDYQWLRKKSAKEIWFLIKSESNIDLGITDNDKQSLISEYLRSHHGDKVVNRWMELNG